MKHSWWKTTMVLLCAILLCISALFVCTSFNIRRQVRQTVEETNANALEFWSSNTENRLSMLYEHVYELLVSLYNNTELRSGTPLMDINTKRLIIDLMNDKMMVSADADALFVLDTDNDFYLYSSSTSLSAKERIALKQKCREAAQINPQALADRRWSTLNVDGENYFFKNFRLGKYIVGAVSRTERFSPEDMVTILGREPVFVLERSDGTLSWLAQKDWQKQQDRCTVRLRVYNLQGEIVLSVVPELGNQSYAQPVLILLDSGLCLLLAVLLLAQLRRRVALPTRRLISANQTLAGGDLDYRLAASPGESSEFSALYESFNDMSRQIRSLKIEAYDLRLREQSNRLTMLRAQIRPHSFLNAVTTISNMTYTCRPEEIRAYIQVFAKYIRYMLNVSDPWITVEAEVGHIRNYLKMQDARFPRAIRFTAEYNAAAGACEIPFLLLYTLVENSIKHAMSLYETLDITVRCVREDREDFHGFCLTEEDSGQGFPEDVAEKLRSGDEPFVKEHLGLSNVRYTLNLTYHRDDLLRLSNRPQGGARVELWIPDKEDNHETSDL